MYKLVTIDLDGTLLNSYGEISMRNKEAIKNTIKRGTMVVLASGRPISSIKSYANELKLKDYVICGNGSVLYDIKQQKIIYDTSIELKKAMKIIKICEENSIFFNIYTDTLVISNSMKYNILFYNNENKKVPEDKKTNIKIVSNIYKYIEENPDIKILKITVCDEDKVVFDRIIKKLKKIKKVEVLELQHMASKYIKYGTEESKIEYYYTEITNKGVDKWEAIKRLSNELQIANSEIISIGDNMNDKLMLENAGIGVAMGNSAPYIKKFADIVVSDNNHDGVAEALENYIIKE